MRYYFDMQKNNATRYIQVFLAGFFSSAILFAILGIFPMLGVRDGSEPEKISNAPTQTAEINPSELEAAALRGEQLKDAQNKRAAGWLRVIDTQLADENGEPIQLRGMSSHGLAWFPEYTNSNAILTLKGYGANLFRVAMYADTSENGYNHDQASKIANKKAVYSAIENALAADVYVIVDYHTLKVENPLYVLDSAIEFFSELSAQYADEPRLIYEICNEPNGNTSWSDIKQYAEAIIPAIRENSPQAIILVGTPDYCTQLQPAIDDPLHFDNVMYVFHYYTSNDGDYYRTALEQARNGGLPVFVSEWGVNRDAETGELNLENARDFIQYMDEHKISWACWSLCNKEESFSAIRPDVTKISGWRWEDLTEVGQLIFSALSN